MDFSASDLADSFERLLGGAFAGVYLVAAIALYVLMVVALWRIFSKAGYFGLLALIPIVNIFFWVKISGYSAWMTLLFLIPLVNLIFMIIVAVRIGRAFGKGGIWSFFLPVVIPVIGALILGFGSARYDRRALI